MIFLILFPYLTTALKFRLQIVQEFFKELVTNHLTTAFSNRLQVKINMFRTFAGDLAPRPQEEPQSSCKEALRSAVLLFGQLFFPAWYFLF